MTPTRKGPLVQQLEGVSDTISKYMADGVRHLGQQNGAVPFGSVEYTPDEVARRELGLWAVRGQARGKVAADFWNGIVDRANPANPEFAGPKAAAAYAAQMEVLWKNPKHRAAALATMAPELRVEFEQLVATGQHPGHMRTLENGREVRLDEPGNVAEHLPGGKE